MSTERGAGVSAEQANIAAGSSHVETQIGRVDTLIENANVVHHSVTYESRTDRLSPPERFRIARHYLDGGAPRTAAAMIHEVVAEGYSSAEVAYYWALAVLSGRPFDHLGGDDFASLRQAYDEAASYPPDDVSAQWRASLHVVGQLLECFVAQESSQGSLPVEQFDRALADLRGLPGERKQEILRHLGTIMHGGEQDRLDAERADEIRKHRMGNGRRRRVPLFFAPQPTFPRRRVPLRPDIGARRILVILGGAALVSLGGLGLAPVAGDLGAGTMAAATALLVIGAVGGGVSMPKHVRRRRGWDRAERELVAALPAAEPDLSQLDRSTFAGEVDALLRQRFGTRPRQRPGEKLDEKIVWLFAIGSARRRTRLRADLIELYGSAESSPAGADKLDWLIRWHAQWTAQAWRDGTLFEPRPRLSAREAALLLGSVAAVAGGGWLGASAIWTRGNGFARAGVALVLLGGWLLLSGLLTVLSDVSLVRQLRAEFEDLYRQEVAAFHRETARLADKPDDGQMARWLDLDKDYLKLRMMRHYELTNNDVIGHVLLIEPAPGCGRAREVGGPLRYTDYAVRLFLLTNNGVRQVDAQINFASGAVNKERRTTFRYDAIGHLNVARSEVRPHGRRQVADPNGGGPANQPPPSVLLQSFDLTLLNSSQIEFKVDHLSWLAENWQETPVGMHQLAEDSSGALSALRTLESVAAEGREWIQREKERYRRSVAEYAEKKRE